MAASCLSTEKIWFDKYKYDDAERQYYEDLSEAGTNAHIQAQSTAAAPNSNGDSRDLQARVTNLEYKNQHLHKVVKYLQLVISKLESWITVLEINATSKKMELNPSPVCKFPAPQPEEEDNDRTDLFGKDDEEEDAEAERIREERLKQYAEKKSKKPGPIAKSSVLLDVKPWDDKTDMAKMEECVHSVQMDGLLWVPSMLVPVGYSIKKLQIPCVVENDKVGTDILEEEITKFEDHVQSVDIAAFNKI
ncbi:elongation factor 1-delta-like [Lithobates pipiens]